MTDQKVWRYPGDSREDRAKRVAKSYRDLALKLAHQEVINPGYEVYCLDRKWIAEDCSWVRGDRFEMDLEEWMSAKDIAHLVDRRPRDIYDWAARKQIEQRTGTDGSSQYLLGSVIEYMKQQRLRRQGMTA